MKGGRFCLAITFLILAFVMVIFLRMDSLRLMKLNHFFGVKMQFNKTVLTTNVCDDVSSGGLGRIPKNVFFYWDGADVPLVVRDNLLHIYEELTPHDYCVKLITNDDVVDALSARWPYLSRIFNEIALPSAKSDIARYLWLYKYGGLYADTHCRFRSSVKSLDKLFNNPYDVVVSKWLTPTIRNSVLLSKPNSTLMKMWVDVSEKKLRMQYQVECNNTKYHRYNVADLTGQMILLNDICFSPDVCLKLTTRDNMTDFSSLKCRHGQFGLVKCLNTDSYFASYSVGADLNHGPNMHKHWSRRQGRERLFGGNASSPQKYCGET